ncbi:hypothetical protein T281_17200 [Rhodomicrobium udaipurense JA643]|uniref:Phage tail tape measure protein n=1 Tax=Rhodomicrobium udaipurense TaxID=1202716 RepID=A0A8I1GG46_9HYPH|nr:hypothetical protein T281_17200 [Rhodomicrobium udaipurense JA643]MBJ7542242.1 phage tail tape measure protein [Rhodomicrobium udaipurense]
MNAAFGNAIGAMNRQFVGFAGSMQRHWGGLQNNLFNSSIGALGFGALFEQQLHFEEKIQNIRALRLDREGSATKRLREETLKLAMLYPVLGGKFGVAEGAEKLVQMGLSLPDVTSNLDSISRASAAAHVPVKEAAESLMHMIQAYNIAFRTPEEKLRAFNYAADAVFSANASFGGTFRSIGKSMARGGPAAALTGLTFDQAAALAGVLEMSGFSAETSGFALSSVFQRIGQLGTSKTGGAVRPMLESYGIEYKAFVGSRDKFRKFGGRGIAESLRKSMHLDIANLVPAIDAIARDPILSANAENLRGAISSLITNQLHLDPNDKKVQGELQKNLGEILAKTYANVDFLGFIKALANTGAYRDMALMSKLAGVFQMPKFQDLVMKALTGDLDERMDQYFHKLTGATRTHLEIWNEGLLGAIKKIAGLWDYFTDQLFNTSGFNDSLNDLAKRFLSFSDSLKSVNPDALWYVAAGLTAISAAAIAGLGLMAVTAGLSALFNPITFVVGALGYLAYRLYQNRVAVREWIAGVPTGAKWGAGIVGGLAAVRIGVGLLAAALRRNPWTLLLTGLITIATAVYENWDRIVAYVEDKIERLRALGREIVGYFDPGSKSTGGTGGFFSRNHEGDITAMRYAQIYEGYRPTDIERQALNVANLHDMLGRFRAQRLRGAGVSIPGMAGGGAASVTQNTNVSVGAPQVSVTINATMTNTTSDALAAKIRAAGQDLGAQIRGGLFDTPQ